MHGELNMTGKYELVRSMYPSVRYLLIAALLAVIVVVPLLFMDWDRIDDSQPGTSPWEGFSGQKHIEDMVGQNHHRWKAGFSLGATQDAVNVSLRIKIIPAQGVRRVKLQQQKILWLKSIHDAWNNHHFIKVGKKLTLPIRVSVKFTPIDPDHEVLVRSGVGGADQHNWTVDMNPRIAAHEVGHMLGAYDEYRGGALSPNAAYVNDESLMGSNTVSGITQPRHLALVLDRVKRVTNISSLSIIRRDLL